MTNIDKIERRIKGLLAQAADREGTPEGEIFQARAFELMARYGVEQAQLDTGDGDELIAREIDLAGAYTPMQFHLAGVVGKALHCYSLGKGNGRKVNRVIFYGKARHAERAVMLFSILNPQMAAGAGKAPQIAGVHGAVRKRSWMLGFIAGVNDRLRAAESEATEAGGQAVAVLDDAKAAEHFAMSQAGKVRNLKTRATTDARAVAAGREAADGMDLGQDRVGGRIAITA